MKRTIPAQRLSGNILKPAEFRTPQEVTYGNNFERNVYLNNEAIDSRTQYRYKMCQPYVKSGMKVLEIACSSGYGTTFFPKDIDYLGIDYDSEIIKLATKEFGDNNHTFRQVDIREFILEKYDVIIALEFLEHISFGIEFAQTLKQYCDTLLCSVPFYEIPGFCGPQHLLYNLDEESFPDFDHYFMGFDGSPIEEPLCFDGTNGMFMIWERGQK